MALVLFLFLSQEKKRPSLTRRQLPCRGVVVREPDAGHPLVRVALVGVAVPAEEQPATMRPVPQLQPASTCPERRRS